MYRHPGHKIDNQDTCDNQHHADNSRKIRNLLESHSPYDSDKHYPHTRPYSVCYTYRDSPQRQTEKIECSRICEYRHDRRDHCKVTPETEAR